MQTASPLSLAIPEFTAPESVEHARSIQNSLRSRLKTYNDFATLNIVAGVDVGYDVARGLAHSSIVVMRLHDLSVLEETQIFLPVDFPYIPGLLSFREIPAILAAMAKLSHKPDLLMVDGHGIAHPRRMGIAAHLGVLLDMPSIGVAKSRLTGSFDIPGPAKGSASPLMVGKEKIGTVVRSREKVNPLFISPGNKVDIETSVTLAMDCVTRYRLPEPTRLADKLSKCPRKA
jgi:deoxyribonuclease V